MSACPDWDSAKKSCLLLPETFRAKIYDLSEIWVKSLSKEAFVLNCFLRLEHLMSAWVSSVFSTSPEASKLGHWQRLGAEIHNYVVYNSA